MADKYAVNYEDERFKNVENEKNQRINEATNTYDDMINNSDRFYQDQINASKEWADKQSEIQQKQNDLAIEKIEQQKDKARKDYEKEQRASYVDYKKQVDPFSVDAEKMAANGLTNSGYSESSRVSMWNTYQNRYASAKESYNNAVLNYDNTIKDAQLANNSALAEIAYNSLQKQLELGLQGFQYKNTLIQQKQSELQQIDETYYNRYQNVLAQINREIDMQRDIDKAVEEANRWLQEFNEQKEQNRQQREQWKKEYLLKEKQAERDYQLALAQERRSAKSAGTYSVGSGDSVELGNGSLSENAKTIYDKFNSMKNAKGSGVVGRAKAVASKTLANSINIANTISIAYKDGRINENDVKILCSKFGI